MKVPKEQVGRERRSREECQAVSGEQYRLIVAGRRRTLRSKAASRLEGSCGIIAMTHAHVSNQSSEVDRP